MVVVVVTAHVLTVVATMLPTGLVDYDWSNGKSQWANLSPMDCDGMLVQQAARNKARNPTARVFVYRNIVKALPWYTEVRKLLQDQSFWGWFVPYDGCRTADGEYVCKNNVTGVIDATANLYHDEQQTPGWTQPRSARDGALGPDGVCHGDAGNNASGPTQSGACDCGVGVACGEYVTLYSAQPPQLGVATELTNVRARRAGICLITGTVRA